LFDRVTGKHGKTKKLNAQEAFRASRRDQAQRDELILRRLQKQRELAKQHDRLKAKPEAAQAELLSDLERFKALRTRNRSPNKPDGHDRER